MSRKLDDLSEKFKPKAFELLARFVEAQIPVLVVDTLRTKEEQERNVAAGVSSTLRSKHLTGDAIDVVLLTNGKPDWNTKDPRWEKLGLIGEKLGLRWGGRWKKPFDPGHFELV